MRQGATRIGVELLMVGLVLGLLGGSTALIVSVYRNRSTERDKSPPVVAMPAIMPDPESEPAPAPAPAPVPPPIDPTPSKLAEIEARRVEQKNASDAADRRADAMEKAAASALAEADRFKSRESLIRREVAKREREARIAEDELDALARERDILAEKTKEERSKLDHARLRARDGVAVLPYKGPNGTWRRPIAIECKANAAFLQPNGPVFRMGDLVAYGHLRMNPLVLAVAKTMLRVRDIATPDGAPSVPYLMFVVRPDGIRPYYAARAILEPLGIAYGYELVDADWDIEFPDLDDPSEWSDGPNVKASPAWPPPPTIDELGQGRGAGSMDQQPGMRPGAGDRPTGRLADGGRPGGERSGIGERPGFGADGRAPVGLTASELAELASRSAGTLAAGGLAALPRTSQPAPGQGGGPGSFDGPGRRPGNPGMGGSGGRVLATPGDGRGMAGRSTRLEKPTWGRLGERGGMGMGQPLDDLDLDALSRGEGLGRDVPRDGRVPFDPGAVEEYPDFRPTPPPGGGDVAGDGTGSEYPGDAAGGARGSMRETIARRHGLDAPRGLSGRQPGVPSRGTPGIPASTVSVASPPAGAGVPSNPTAPTPTPGGNRPPLPSGVVPGALATNAGAASANGTAATASGSGNARAGSNMTGASSAASGSPMGMPGGSPGSSDGQGSGGAGWDDSNGIRSRSVEMTVACGPKGVTIHPGGETIPLSAIMADDRLVPSKLSAIVEAQRALDPIVGLRPKVRFVMKAGGEAAYQKARWQTTVAGTGWPMSLQVADRSPVHLLGGGSR